jgi:hypothetical protein
MSKHLEVDEADYRHADCKWVWRLGGIAAFILMVYCVALMVQIVALGGPPASAGEAFRLLREDRIVGLLRLDLPTMFAMPVYYVLFLALYAALRSDDRPLAALGTVLALAGLTLFLAAPSALSMASLSDKYAAASTESARAQFLAAGEAVMATDLWHGTSAIIGGVLMQVGAVLMCVVMLRGGVFGRMTAWIGIVMYGLDLTHILAMVWLPLAGMVLMAIAGPLYPVWFFLVGRRLVAIGGSLSSGPTVEIRRQKPAPS